jgi:hypothetical protein
MEGKQPTHSEEIDLAYLFRPLYTRVTRYFAVLRANILLFFGIILGMTVLGYGLRYIIPRTYETEGVFATRFLPAKYCELLVDDLDVHLGEPLIADRLHIGSDVAADIARISVTPITDQLDPNDSLLQSFVLRVRLKKIDRLDSIQNALVGYFDNNQYALRRKEERTVALTALRQGVIRRIASLDSIAPIVNSGILPRNAGSGIVLQQPIDPVGVYKAQDSFYRQRVRIETELGNAGNIEVVQTFLKLGEPNYPRMWMVTLGFTAGGLLLALFLTPALGKKH